MGGSPAVRHCCTSRPAGRRRLGTLIRGRRRAGLQMRLLPIRLLQPAPPPTPPGLQNEMRRTGCAVDARLLSYAFGIEHAKEAAALVVAEAAARAAAAGHGDGSSSSSIALRPFGLDALGAPDGAGGSVDLHGAAANGSAGGGTFDASDVPLPFGSPVMSPAWLQSSRSGEQPAGAAQRHSSEDAAAAEPAGSVEAGGGARSERAGMAGASSLSGQLGSLLHARSSWLLFAAGWGAGAAGCALLLSRRTHSL